MNLDNAALSEIIAAIGGLGLASSALLDSTKALPGGGVSNSGFKSIEAAVKLFLPDASRAENTPDLAASVLQTLNANWINGMAAPDQKAIAKSLIKLRLSPASAVQYANVTQVDVVALKAAAENMTTGEQLAGNQTNALGRFDLALTAILDAAYQRADQRYRNVSKAWAGVIAVVIALVGGALVDKSLDVFFTSSHWALSLMCGVLAVPLAPVSKDLTSALAAGVKLAQSLKA